MANEVLVDIDHFSLWMEGTLLRFENGKGICVNEVQCQKAEDAALNGEKVHFMRDGKLTGTELVFDKEREAFIEQEIKKGEKKDAEKSD